MVVWVCLEAHGVREVWVCLESHGVRECGVLVVRRIVVVVLGVSRHPEYERCGGGGGLVETGCLQLRGAMAASSARARGGLRGRSVLLQWRGQNVRGQKECGHAGASRRVNAARAGASGAEACYYSARAESARALGGLRGRGVLLQRAQGVGQQGEKLEGVKSRNNVA